MSDGDRLVGSERVLAVLIEVAKHPAGVTLDELAQTLDSSKPTVHRALGSLRKSGLVEQIGRGVYLLGDEFLRLAFRNHDARPESARLEPVLRALAAEFGETAHYAVLDGHDVVYRAKIDPPTGAVRLTSVIGGRNPAYRTAVGKLLLSSLVNSEAALESWIGGQVLEQHAPHTLTSAPALWAELVRTRERGYGLDDQECDPGVNCVALPVHLDGAATPAGAISVSGLAFRAPLATLEAAVPRIRAIVDEHLGAGASGG
jgi:DNA-binding IclR family transcriptional regulator